MLSFLLKPTGTKQSISTSESVPGTPNKSDSDSRRTPNKHHSESLRETPDKRQRPTQEEVRVTPMKLAQKIVATPLISTDEQPKSQVSAGNFF